MAVEAQVPVAVINDGQQPEARQPVGIHHAAVIDRPHRRTLRAGEQHAVPFHATRARLAERSHQPAGHGPRQLAAQLRERVLAVGWKLVDALQRAPQFAHQLFQAALLLLEAFELLWRGSSTRLPAIPARDRGVRARRCSRETSPFCRGFERGQALLLRGQFRIELAELGQMRIDGGDLAGARTAEVLVIDEHAAGLAGIALVEQ